MHQGSLKSAVRRSLTKSLLLPPGDSDEVVQSKATGKTRATAATEFISGKTSRGQDPNPSKGKEEEKAMAYRNSNDFQLLQVSREAQKLTKMIDSWSMTTNIHGRSQFFAEDLLKSALDLQESLGMLKKLQDATIQVNNKQKQEASGRRHEKIFIQDVAGNHRNRLHESRISSDDLSRSGVELKEVMIQERLYEPNIMSSSSDDDKCSSSRSMTYSKRNIFKDNCVRHPVPYNSISSTDQPKKARSSNVIAKLMGLEEVPTKTIQPIRTEEKDCVNLPRPRFDIEMPNARKTQFVSQNDDQKQSRFDEIVEAMHFKGLLKQNQVEEKGHVPPFFTATEVEQCGRSFHRADYLPPIVIMKPTHLLYQESNVHKELPRDKVVMSNIEECKLIQENYSSDCHKHMLAKFKTQEKKELKNIKEINESLPNYHMPLSLYHKLQSEQVVGHKMNTGEQKPSRLDLKRQEMGIKATRMTMTNHKSSTVSVNKELPKGRTNMSTPHNQDFKPHFRPIPKETIGSTKDKNKPGVKPLDRSSIFDASIEGKHSNESGTAIRSKKLNDVPKATGSFSRNNLLVQVKRETKFWNPDNVTKDHKIFCEATPKSGQREENCKLIEVIQLPECKKVNGAVARIGEDLNDIFLSSQSFLSCAKKFFGLNATLPMYYQRESSDGIMKLDTKLIIDLSVELMARKYQQMKLIIHPLMQTQSSASVTYSSIDKLVDDISIGITKLTNYYKLGSLHTSEGTLYLKLERDLMCKDTAVNSTWNFGWDHWICLEEADQVAEEVGRQILSRLIEEAALELIMTACLLDY